MLEVRALDTEHVYALVAWLNRPEDLGTGRKSYHGKYELIPTNQMDIIDAMTVNGPCDVVRWDEQDDESPPLPEVSSMPFCQRVRCGKLMDVQDQFFWRQTYDHVGTKTFSHLRKICVDDAPVNPDEMILQCGKDGCKKWQHIKCIAEAAVKQSGASRLPPSPPTTIRTSLTFLQPTRTAPRRNPPKERSPPTATASRSAPTPWRKPWRPRTARRARS